MQNRNNIFIQVAVMLISISVTAYTLSRFALLIQSLLSIPYDWKLEGAIVIGQLLFQFPFLFRKKSIKIFNYYYNMLLVSLTGSMMLWPIIIWNMVAQVTQVWNIIYFFAVVAVLFLDHMRRVKKLHLPAYLCYTWVIYRILILICIL